MMNKSVPLPHTSASPASSHIPAVRANSTAGTRRRTHSRRKAHTRNILPPPPPSSLSAAGSAKKGFPASAPRTRMSAASPRRACARTAGALAATPPPTRDRTSPRTGHLSPRRRLPQRTPAGSPGQVSGCRRLRTTLLRGTVSSRADAGRG
eukprot:758442-Hanusia_phi.AAC.1